MTDQLKELLNKAGWFISHPHTNCEAKEVFEGLIAEITWLQKKNKRLSFMVENGLGEEDMRSDRIDIS